MKTTNREYGFAVMPGSHKRNFTLDPKRWSTAGIETPGAIEITGEPGDVMLSSEALMHTGAAKTTKRRRTTLHYNHVDRERISLMTDRQNVRHFWMPPSHSRTFYSRTKSTNGMDELDARASISHVTSRCHRR